MDKSTIDNLQRELTVNLFSESPLRATFIKNCEQLRQDNVTLDQFSEALDTIQIGYDQNKLSYPYVARRQIDKCLVELSKVKTYKVIGNTIGSAGKKTVETVEPLWTKAIKPAAKSTVVPAAVAVKGFFRGLFGSSGGK